MSARRKALLERLFAVGREQSTATVMFHAAVAEHQGLSATEEKALDILDRHGPLTAGQLTEQSGLAPASVTGLLDRLEAKGFARRVPNPSDGRSVLVEAVPDRLGDLAPLFDDWVKELRELCAKYTNEQLETVIDFLAEGTLRQQTVTQRLLGGADPTDRTQRAAVTAARRRER